jgi:hypothetical protein
LMPPTDQLARHTIDDGLDAPDMRQGVVGDVEDPQGLRQKWDRSSGASM